MKHTAYCVLIIKPGTPSVVQGAGVFSEPTPSLGLLHCVTLFTEEGETYGAAHDRAVERMASNCYDWCGKYQRTEYRAYRDARVP